MFHRTPTHRDLLRAIAEGRPREPLGPGLSHVALYELRVARLIVVDPSTGAVAITAAGRQALDEWSTPSRFAHAS